MYCYNCYYEKIGNKEYCINDEIPFDVPDNWIWCRLGTIFNIGSSKRVHKSDWKDNGIPFYRARDIELLNKNIFKSNLYISVEFYNKIKRTYGIPQINDILVTAVGSLGKTFIVKDKNPFYYKDGNIICFSNFSNINPHYIQILFESSFMNDQIYSYSKGTTVNTYTIIHANKTLIPIPPLKEQKEIINTLQKTLKQIEIVEKAKKDIANLTNSLKSKVLDNIFGENSSYKSYYENREKITLKSFFKSNEIGDGDWVLSEDMAENGEYSLIQLKHIESGKFISKPYKHINKDFFLKNKCSEIKENYILINRLISDSMKVCLTPKLNFKAITCVDVCWIAPTTKINQKYLMYYLLSPIFQNKIMIKSSGSTRKRISKKNLINIDLYIHSAKEEQKAICDYLDKIFDLANTVSSHNN